MELIRLGLEDLEEIVSLESRLFPKESWTEDQLREELTNPLSYYLGIRDSGQLVAYGGAKGIEDVEIMTIGVLQQYRRRGLGRRLLEDMLAWAGPRPVFLEVRASNAAAIGLYQDMGFVQLRRIRGYYRFPSEDAIAMGRGIETTEFRKSPR